MSDRRLWNLGETRHNGFKKEKKAQIPTFQGVTLLCRQRISVCRLLFFKQTLYVVMTLQGADLVEGGFVATVESCFRMNGG